MPARPYGFYTPAVDALFCGSPETLRPRLIAALLGEGLDEEKATLVASGMAIAAIAALLKTGAKFHRLVGDFEEPVAANDEQTKGSAA
jgi:hypothetical protein